MALPGLSQALKKPSNHANAHDAPQRKAVVLERHAEDKTNIPYRGSVDHGQGKIDQNFNPELQVWDDKPAPNAPEIDPPTPVPVYVVADSDPGERVINWRTGVVYATNPPVQLMGRHNARKRVVLKSLDAGTVWIGHDAQSAAVGFGFPLAQGERLELLSTVQPIYAYAASQQQIAYFVEYEVIVP